MTTSRVALVACVLAVGGREGLKKHQKAPVEFFLRDVDQNRGLTVLATVGTLGAAALGVFGLPPVDLHGPLHYLGIMDPLCGMTRAIRALAVGDRALAWRYNPGSFVLAVSAAVMLARGGIGLLTGRWISVRVIWRRILWSALILASVALSINQQLHAQFLS